MLTTSFDLDDNSIVGGTSRLTHVLWSSAAPVLVNGDYAGAAGTLNPATNPPTLTATDVDKY